MKPRYKIYVYPLIFIKFFLKSLYLKQDKVDSSFNSKIKEFLKSENSLFINQARVGIFLTVKSIIEKTGKNEVVLSPYTIADVINMVILAGGIPIFVDIEEETCNINHKLIEESITENCSAILVTHLHGRMCNMDQIKKIANKFSLYLIEDAAQSFGAKQNHKYAGTIGDVGIFSFGLYKNLSSIYGGAIVSNNDELFQIIKNQHSKFYKFKIKWYLKKLFKAFVTITATSNLLFRPFVLPIIKFGYFNKIKFINRFVETELDISRKKKIPNVYLTKPSKLQKLLVINNIDFVKKDESLRVKYALLYQKSLSSIPQLSFSDNSQTKDNIYTYFPIYLKDMEKLRSYLIKNNVDVGPQHYKNTASLTSFNDFYRPCPVAERVSKSLLLLPTYPRYQEKNVYRKLK